VRLENPLIIQSDKTLLLEVNNPYFEEARNIIGQFADLEKSPEYMHFYRISPLSLWNAASAKISYEQIKDALYRFSKYEVPQNVLADVREQINRYGKIKLIKEDSEGGGFRLAITSAEAPFIKEITNQKTVIPYIEEKAGPNKFYIKANSRGFIKQALIKIGYPVEDLAGYEKGAPYSFDILETTNSNQTFEIRDYQRDSIDVFYREGKVDGGSGVIVLPCGAGKTIVGIGVMGKIQAETLVLVTNTLSIRQWYQELTDKTTIPPEDIGEYSGERKEIKPITIATYNILTYRKKKGEDFSHFHLFTEKKWGLIIYDEVHLLPAPVFRMTSEIQAIRRLGLTATLIREDGLEEDVFSLIGPKKYDVPWKDLEKKSWIAQAECVEVRQPMDPGLRMKYATASDREKFRIASENPAKIEVTEQIIEEFPDANILIIGQYIQQLEKFSKKFGYPLITGKLPNREREKLYAAFRKGEEKVLIVSKVANFSVDLPDANIAIQISGTFGSRQEEAQRLGRILRPKQAGDNKAYFFSLVSSDSVEERFAENRQRFLAEQGYNYSIYNQEDFRFPLPQSPTLQEDDFGF
jgi:DNA excision repair protein ERCC-3